jgi:hypothetical protein
VSLYTLVSLYKIGGFYFVLEGHYWVSVARYHGVEWIDAEVTEFGSGSRSDGVAGGDQLPQER